MFSLANGGHCASNTVYVDNAVDGCIRAIATDDAVGSGFVIVDIERSWAEWSSAFGRWLGQPLFSVGVKAAEALERASSRQRPRLARQDAVNLFRTPECKQLMVAAAQSSHMGAWVMRALGKLLERGRTLVRERALCACPAPIAVESSDSPLPGLSMRQVYVSRTRFDNRKTEQILGFGPMTDWSRSRDATESWARRARFL